MSKQKYDVLTGRQKSDDEYEALIEIHGHVHGLPTTDLDEMRTVVTGILNSLSKSR